MVRAWPARGKPAAVHKIYYGMEYIGFRAYTSPMDSIQVMRVFIRVVETGSFSRAAAELGLAQPTATKAVAEAEQRLGARLLHRSTRGVSPTEVGSLYYERCKSITLDVAEAEAVATLGQGEMTGTLRITSSVGFGRRVMAPLVLAYMREHARLVIDLSLDDRYVNLVEQGMDVAVRMGRLADSTLGANYLAHNPWLVAASPSYLAERGTPDSPQALLHHDALIYSSVQGEDRWLLNGPSGSPTRSFAVRARLRSNNLSTVLSACQAGMGLCTLPRYVAHQSLVRGEIVQVLPDWTPPAQEVHAAYPSPRLLPRKVSHFIGWLRTQLSGDWWSRSHGAKFKV
jgi:DNA-binding transcriptional LysR family regulator